MPPTGASSLNRRGARMPPGEGFPFTRYMGMAAAAIISVASGVNLYEKHKHQFIGDPHGMPKRIQNQILGTNDDEGDDDGYLLARATASASNQRNVTSTASAGGEYPSAEELESLQDHYKNELNVCNEQEDFTRASHIAVTLDMIQQDLSMRHQVSCASSAGRTETVVAIASKLRKVQVALKQRLDEDMASEHGEEEMASEHADSEKAYMYSSDDDLSKDEVVFLRAQLEEKKKTIDFTTLEGAAELRGCYKRSKTLDEAMDLLEAIEEDEDDEGLRERLSLIKRELFNTLRPQGFLSGLFGGSQISASKKSTKAKKRRAQKKTQCSQKRKKTDSGSGPSLEKRKPVRTSSGRTTHPPDAFVAVPASRKGNDDTIAGPRAEAHEPSAALSNDQNKTFPSPKASSERDPPECFAKVDDAPVFEAAKKKAARSFSSESSMVTSENTKAKNPDFVESAPEYGQGWIVKGFIRKNGNQKGHIDKYWYSPCGRKLRSKKEVERFLKESVNLESEATNTSSNSTNEIYVIKCILGRKFNPASERTEYLIRWEGYPDPASFTFEPIENLGHRHVKEPDNRWGADTEADPDKIEVNDVQRDSSDVLRYAQLMGLKTNISTSDSDDEDKVDGTYTEEEEEEEEEEGEEEEAMEAATEQDNNDRKEDSLNEVATDGDHKTSTVSTGVGAPLSFDSDPLLDQMHQPNDDEEDTSMRDDASASSETTCNGAGSLL